MTCQHWMRKYLQIVLGASLALSTGSSMANYLDGQGREWLDMSLTRGASWNAINNVCQSSNEVAGPCNGLLGGQGGYDLTGWTWANRAEVLELIQGFMVSSGDNTAQAALVSQNGYGTQDYAWATDLIDAMGQTGMLGFGSDRRTIGFMNGTDTVGNTTTGQMAFVCTGSPCGFASYVGAGVSAGVGVSQSNDMYSGWFHRAADNQTVPEPAALVLVLTGLAGLGALRLRQRARS